MIHMGIRNALGFGIAIILLKFLIPKIFAGMEMTLLSLFDVINLVLTNAKESVTAGVGFIPQ